MNLNTEMSVIPYLLVAQAGVIMSLLEQGVILMIPGALAKIATITGVVMKRQMELKRKLIKIVIVLAPARS